MEIPKGSTAGMSSCVGLKSQVIDLLCTAKGNKHECGSSLLRAVQSTSLFLSEAGTTIPCAWRGEHTLMRCYWAVRAPAPCDLALSEIVAA